MTFTRTIRTALAAVGAVVVVAPSAFAGGEPKNQPPFTRPVPQTTTIVVEQPAGGFHWVDALIGAGAVLGTGLAGGGALAIRSGRRAQPSTAF